MKFIYTVFVNALALFIVSLLLSDFALIGTWLTPVVLGLIMTILNAVVRPILRLLTFPLIFFSAGLFLIVINAVILYIAEYLILVMDISGVGLQINGLLTYLLAAIIFGVANWTLNWFLKE